MSQTQYYGATGSGAKTDEFWAPNSGNYGTVTRNGGGGSNNNASGGESFGVVGHGSNGGATSQTWSNSYYGAATPQNYGYRSESNSPTPPRSVSGSPQCRQQ